jgi:hypothetical protein
MFDSNLMLIDSSADVEATVTGTGQLIGASMVPEKWACHVPSVSGTTPKCVWSIEESDALGSGYTQLTSLEIEAAGVYHMTVNCSKKYRRAVLTISGTNPNFGEVEVGRVAGGQDSDW